MRIAGAILMLVKNYGTKNIFKYPVKGTKIFSCINYKLVTVYQSLSQFLMSIFI